jgi:hypothetical protein
MTRQQSNMDLAGSLAATLTPRVTRADSQPVRASQNSGLFDVGALYAEAFQQVALRTRSDPRLRMPLARAAQATWPATTRWPQPVLSYAPDPEIPIDPVEAFSYRPRGLGWFGIAVAWLATITTSALIATTLPAHAPTHARALAAVAAVLATPAAASVASPPRPPTPPVAAAAPQPEVPTIPISAIPMVSFAAAPRPTVSFAAAPRPTAVPSAPAPAAPPAVHVAPRKVTPRVAAPQAAARPAPAPVAAAPPAPATSAPHVAAAPVKPVQAAPAPASTAGMSLDDLIRREVQAESAKHAH